MAFQISIEARKRLEEIKARYPKLQSAVMAGLYIAQEEHGFLSDEVIDWAAAEFQMTPAHVLEMATFYTMYRRKPQGKYHVQVCRTLACALCGAKKLTERLKERFQIEAGEVTADGMWSYQEVECLGSCGSAPLCEINDSYFENLSEEKLDALLDRIAKEKPDLNFSTVKGKMGKGMRGELRSAVMKGAEIPTE
jgi:NADH-quinone oxidoreductase E subunit